MRGEKSKRMLGLLVGALASATFAGANLQTFVLGATEITQETESLEAGVEYSISNIEGFLHFRDLVNAGKVHRKAKIALATNLDLTEAGTYTHGYCDKPAFSKTGELVGWYKAQVDAAGMVRWTREELDLTDTVEFTVDVAEIEDGKKYVIKRNEEYLDFIESCLGKDGKCGPGGKERITAFLVGGAEDCDEGYVEEVDEDGNPVGWYETEIKFDGSFDVREMKWARKGDGGGLYTPIGTPKNAFAAMFDGQGHDVTITINFDHDDDGKGFKDVGVFGYVTGIISNFGVSRGSHIAVNGGTYEIGGIAGQLRGGAIIKCCNLGDIWAKSGYGNIGGVVGRATDGSRMIGLCNAGDIKVRDACGNFGGVAGIIATSSVTGSYNTGNINVEGCESNDPGGVAGTVIKSTVSGCCNLGNIWLMIKKEPTLGFAGGITGVAAWSRIEGCYNKGRVKVSDGTYLLKGFVGGIVGRANGKVKMNRCYYSENISRVIGRDLAATKEDNVGPESCDYMETADFANLLNAELRGVDQKVSVEFRHVCSQPGVPGQEGVGERILVPVVGNKPFARVPGRTPKLRWQMA